jgi:hypothetical protein
MKLKKFILFLYTIFVANVSFNNLLKNSGFEYLNDFVSIPSSWSVANWSFVKEVSNEQVHSGNYSLKISTIANSTRNYYLYQFVKVEPLATYILSGYVYKNNEVGTASLVVSYGSSPIVYNKTINSDIGVWTTTSSTSWQYLEKTFVIPQDITTMTIHCNLRCQYGYSATVYFDDICFVKESSAPADITTLTATTGLNSGEVILKWLAPGNDGFSGQIIYGSEYIIKYTSDITKLDIVFSSTQNPNVLVSTSDVNPTELQTYTVERLEEGVTYYFSIWTKDNSGNFSTISNCATAWAMYSTDFVEPGMIEDLAVLPITEDNKITLKWTSSGDDGYVGNLNGKYLIQYASQTMINKIFWDISAAQIVVSTINVTPGSTQFYTINLPCDTTYYFRIWVIDESNNCSVVSNGATVYLGVYPPEPISDLTSVLWDITCGSIGLQWTAPSDKPLADAVSSYVIKYATWDFTDVDFDNVNNARFVIIPKPPNEKEFLVLTGLPSGQTIYFHIKSLDSVGNYSPVDTSHAYVYIPPHIIITEIATRTQFGASEEYVELYNPTDYDIIIGTITGGLNLKLFRRNSSGNQFNMSLNYLNHIIFSKGYFLLATSTKATNGVEPDAKFYGSITDSGSLFITFGSSVYDSVDIVSYGDIEDSFILKYETLVSTSANFSIHRKRNGNQYIDTNNNKHDFINDIFSPKNSKYVEPPKAANWVFNEMLLTTSSIMYVIQDNAEDEEAIYISSATNVFSRISENLGPLAATGLHTSWTEQNLSPNTKYVRYIETYKTSVSSWSVPITLYTFANNPQNLSVLSVYQSSVTLVWDNNSNPQTTKYGVEFAEDQNFSVKLTTVVSCSDNFRNTRIVVEDLDTDTTFYFRVWAYNEDGVMSGYSNIVSTKTLGSPPKCPNSFNGVAISTSSILWYWDIVNKTTCYQIYDADNNKLIKSIENGKTTSYIEGNLLVNQKYKRYIIATNQFGISQASQVKSVFTTANPPIGLKIVEVGNTNINLSWSENQNPIWTKYEVLQSLDNFRTDVSTPVKVFDNYTYNKIEIKNLNPDTTYYFKVRAYSGDNIPTLFSNVVSTKTLKTSSVVISQFATRGSETAYDEFVELYNRTNVPVNISNWKLEYYDGSSWKQVLKIPQDSFIKGYSFYLISSSSQYFKTVSADLYHPNYLGFADGKKDEARGIRIVDSSGKVVDTVVYENNGGTLNKEAEGGITAPNHGSSANIKSVIRKVLSDGIYVDTDNNNNDFVVLEIRNPHNSTMYQPDKIPPSDISDLVVYQTKNENELVLKWTSPGNNYVDGVIQNAVYRIKYSTIPFDSFSYIDDYSIEFSTKVSPLEKVEYTVSGLKPGSLYYFGIIVRDDDGNWSSWRKNLITNTSNFAYVLDLPPSAPTQVSLSVLSNKTIELCWTNPVDCNDIDKYWVFYATFSFISLSENVIHISTVPCILNDKVIKTLITGLKNNIHYFFRIVSVDKEDTGDGFYGKPFKSDFSIEVSTKLTLAPPTNLYAVHKGTCVVLNWSVLEHEFKYSIYRSEVKNINENFNEFINKYELVGYTDNIFYYDTRNIDKDKFYSYFVCSEDEEGNKSVPSNIVLAIFDSLPPEFVEVTKLDSSCLTKNSVVVDIEIVDDRVTKGDRQGKIMSVKGKYRKLNLPITEKEIVISTYVYKNSEFLGSAVLELSFLATDTYGIEYYFEAKDELYTTRWPTVGKLYPDGYWYSVELPNDKPTKKFVSPYDPNIVFGKDVDEVIIFDQQGNKIWSKVSQSSNSIIIWDGKSEDNKFVESGAYIYKIKTKDGKRKYGVVIVVK